MKTAIYACLFVCAVMVALAGTSFAAQAASPVLAKELVATWDRAATDIIDIAEAMPEDKYGFKATPEMQSFRDQLVHCAGIVQRYIDTAKGTKTEAAHAHGTLPKAEVVSLLKKTFQEGKELFASMSDAQMLEQVKFPVGDRMVTRNTYWLGPLYQVRNHHGQLVVYLRQNGVVPPTTARRRAR